MQSPYKTIIVYDLETGGLSSKINHITEMAMVAINAETLDIIEEFSVMMKPWLNLENVEEEPLKEARELFKALKQKDEDSGLNILRYKDNLITLKNLDPLIEDIEMFYEFLSTHGNILTYEDILKLEASENLSDITKLFFDKTYNPQALEVTHISREMMVSEGVKKEEAFKQIREMISRHTVGNSKPILAGHNIGSLPRRIVRGKEKGPDGFDNPFMEKFFKENGDDFFDCINDKIIDTLKEARLKWYDLPSFNLGTCCNEVGLTLKEAHRALPDTVANAQFLVKILKSLRGEGNQQSKYKRRKYKFQF